MGHQCSTLSQVMLPLCGSMKRLPEPEIWTNHYGTTTTTVWGSQWYVPHRPDAKRQVLVYFPGNAMLPDHAMNWIRKMAPRAHILVVNYRANVQGGGVPSIYRFERDARFACDFLQALNIAPQHITAMGFSIGTGVATTFAQYMEEDTGKGLRRLVLDAPYDNFKHVVQLFLQHRVGSWSVSLATIMRKELYHFEPCVAARKLQKTPTLVFVRTQDTLIYPEAQRAMANCITGTRRIVHYVPAEHNQLFLQLQKSSIFQSWKFWEHTVASHNSLEP